MLLFVIGIKKVHIPFDITSEVEPTRMDSTFIRLYEQAFFSIYATVFYIF